MRKYLNCIWVILLLAAVLTACGKKDCSHANQETVGAVAATCTEKGYTGDTKCLDCGEVLQAGSEVAVLEHKAVVEGAVPATCLEGGKTGVSTCELCKAVLQENTDIPATGHTSNVVNKTDATCTEDGYSGDTVCSTCDTVIEKGSVVPAAHTSETKGYKAATCTSSGYSGDEYCSSCGQKLKTGTTIAKLEHNIATKNEKAATCGENGYTGDTYCVYCNVTMSTGTVIPAKGEHSRMKYNQIPATTTKEGYSGDIKCDYCGILLEKGHVTDKLPILPEYTCYTDVQQSIFKEFNEIRAENGLGTLKYDNAIQPAVYNRVREYIWMYVQGNNTNAGPHCRPDGSRWAAALDEIGYQYSLCGENIAGPSVRNDVFVEAWMNSPPHKEAILNSVYTHVAICVVCVQTNYGNEYCAVAIFHNNTSL